MSNYSIYSLPDKKLVMVAVKNNKFLKEFVPANDSINDAPISLPSRENVVDIFARR